MIMPAATLAIISIAGYSRYVRSSMLEVLNQDYIRTARAKGVREWLVVFRHGLVGRCEVVEGAASSRLVNQVLAPILPLRARLERDVGVGIVHDRFRRASEGHGTREDQAGKADPAIGGRTHGFPLTEDDATTLTRERIDPSEKFRDTCPRHAPFRAS
jgi:hypothetical protein